MKTDKILMQVSLVFAWVMAVTMVLLMMVYWYDANWKRWFYLALVIINTANAVWASVNYYRYTRATKEIKRIFGEIRLLHYMEEINNEDVENQMDIH